MKTVTRKKKIIFFIIIIAAILICAFAIWKISVRPKLQSVSRPIYSQSDTVGEYENSVVGEGLELAVENDLLKLYFDNETGGVAVEDKGTGEIFTSSPQSALEDAKASDVVKNQLRSPLLLTYYNKDSKTTTVFDSYTNAILLNQVTWAKLDNGIRVNMVMGRPETTRLLPEQISAASFDALLARVEEANSSLAAKKVKAFYLFYTLETADEEQKAKYPILETTDIYTLKTSVNDRDKKTLEGYFQKAGYTYEEMEQEYANLNYVSTAESFPCFKLSIDYILNENSLDVSLNTGAIEYDQSKFFLTYISMLPYFGAGMTGEEGYIFLPDGSGTLIGFNNDGSKTTFLTRGKMYGNDGAEETLDRGSTKYEFRYPVFGVKTAEQAIFGIVTDGDAVSGINAEIGNLSHSYNTSYADFMIRSKSQYVADNAFEQDPWVVYDEKGYDGMISLKYSFLTGENADYVGMAQAYRSYLLNEGKISLVAAEENLPFMLETIGTVKKPIRKLGIPVVDNVAITTFDDSYKMLEYFKEQGISDLNLRYKAWYNGGFYHNVSAHMDVEKVIGGKKGLKDLAEKGTSLGAHIFPDVDFLIHDNNTGLDEYSPTRDGVRTLFQKNGFYPKFITPLLRMTSWYFCVNPEAVLSYYDSFTKDYSNIGLSNISLGSAGEVLNSNYDEDNYVNRQDSKNISAEMLRKADESYEEIIVDGGNAYTFGYADYILNMPTSDSSYLIADQSVPFIQIALHGYIQYADSAINLSSEINKAILNNIEYGCIPYFLLSYNEGSIIKESYVYDDLYSVDYDNWKDRAVEIYQEVNKALSGVQNVPIKDHSKLMEDVYVTTYENGTEIYVNYSDETVETQGVTIAPMSYAIKQIGGE
ncbi:MAG: hypothetical protein K0S47_1802 [Herbinix sp.]|jgi:hypothetical protein|nr:hypothetical protein [Herbinix sp.]